VPEDRLDIDDVDLESLILARNDAHPDGDWWFDPRTGDTLYLGVDDDEDLDRLVRGVHVLIPREPQPREDIDDFLASDELAAVGSDVVVRLLEAYRGRGGLRRFREVVPRTPAAEAWGRFMLAREGARAIDWLIDRGLVEDAPGRRRIGELRGSLDVEADRE
jgi:GNAT superfamily N-acetyltransferase